MQHRVYLQRNAASADAYGHKEPASWTALATVAGYVWVVREDTAHDLERTAVETRYRAIVPLDTDVTEKDRIEKVEDRAESPTQLFGTMYIDAVVRRRDHVELRMRGHA